MPKRSSMGQNGPKDYKNWHFVYFLGVRNDPRVPTIRGGRVPISGQHIGKI